MDSIYHFFKSLVKNKRYFKNSGKLEVFPFDASQLSCKNIGIFPDMAIRVNKDKSIFTGGELIELKDSDSYTVSSFNSTIPSRTKEILKVVQGEKSGIRKQMIEAGDDIDSLPLRDVFYLVRGRKNNNTKVCLIYGSFFETIRISELISQSFSQVLEERLKQTEGEITDELKKMITTLFSEQENFSKVRNVEKASVKLRFRVMTEVKAEGNILNSKKYSEIADNTLNLLLPCHNDEEEKHIRKKIELVFSKTGIGSFKIFKIKHHFNGYFLVIQVAL